MALPSIPDSELGPYFENQPIDPLPVYRLFAQSGKIATRRARGPYEFRSEDFTLLLQCYEHGLSLGHPGCDYRDAVIDAMVENLDDYASATYQDWGQLLAATKGHPMCSMWRLVCFFHALVTRPEYVLSLRMSGDDTLERCLREELERLPKGVITRDIWEQSLQKGRCRLHEHGHGTCWRLDTGYGSPLAVL
jgi:hypothetical protein